MAHQPVKQLCSYDAAEDESRLDTSAGDPGVDGQFHPGGHGDSANVTALAEQIDDCPVLVSLLKMGYAQPSYRSRGQALGELNNWSGTPVQQKDQGFSPTNWPNLRPKK
jgi:hypothetical protein